MWELYSQRLGSRGCVIGDSHSYAASMSTVEGADEADRIALKRYVLHCLRSREHFDGMCESLTAGASQSRLYRRWDIRAGYRKGHRSLPHSLLDSI